MANGSKQRRKSPVKSDTAFKNIAALIDGVGEITIGRIGEVRCGARAADEDRLLAMLVARRGETLLQLMTRLDTAIEVAWEQDFFIDEINDALSGQFKS